MKRTLFTLGICVCLVACSGQRNQSTKVLNSGERDAADEGEQPEDDAGEETVTPEPDAGEPNGNGDTGSALDAETPDAGSDAGDTGPGESDASDAATDAGMEAGPSSDASVFSITVRRGSQPLADIPIFFSFADGGVERSAPTGSDGVLRSSSVPALATVVLPPADGRGDSHTELLSVVAPASGDHVVVELPPGPSDPVAGTPPYQLHVDPIIGGYQLSAFAGVDGCALGFDSFYTPQPDFHIGVPPNCELEPNGSVLVRVGDSNDRVLAYASAPLPQRNTDGPAQVTLSAWQPPEQLTLTLLSPLANRTVNANAFLRKGKLVVPADPTQGSSPGPFPFFVPRSMVDSYDTELTFAGSPQNFHVLRKNRPAASTNIDFDGAQLLAEISDLNPNSSSVLRPSASWTLTGETSADAVVASFGWSWIVNSDFRGTLTWRFVAAPGVTSVAVPELPMFSLSPLPGPGVLAFPVIAANANVQFDGVTYYESDHESGVRDFLKEPLRLLDRDNGDPLGATAFDFRRVLPAGANQRWLRFDATGT